MARPLAVRLRRTMMAARGQLRRMEILLPETEGAEEPRHDTCSCC